MRGVDVGGRYGLRGIYMCVDRRGRIVEAEDCMGMVGKVCVGGCAHRLGSDGDGHEEPAFCSREQDGREQKIQMGYARMTRPYQSTMTLHPHLLHCPRQIGRAHV